MRALVTLLFSIAVVNFCAERLGGLTIKSLFKQGAVTETADYVSGLEPRSTSDDEGPTYLTENVFLVVIDGIRNDEAFDDSTHQFIPHIWNELRPLGTIYSDFYNRGHTSTTSGQLSIGSGVRQVYRISDSRLSEEPNFFEHYRAQRNVPIEETWVIANTRLQESEVYFSEHPAFGADYGASMWLNPPVPDTEVLQQTMEIMGSYHPSLVVIWFKNVDTRAHESDWEAYTEAIVTVDSLVYDLWNYIESDSIYGGRTTMIVTADHGRHDDQHGGYAHHGDHCHGCRHLPFLAIGTDIRADTVIEEVGDQIDIAPTIAELLGFEMPMADGRVLREMFNAQFSSQETSDSLRPSEFWTDNAARLTVSPQVSKDPQLVGQNGSFHVAWMERDTTSVDEAWEIWYAVPGDSSSHVRLFSKIGDRSPILTTFGGDAPDNRIYAGTGYWKWAADFPGAEPTYLWGISGRGKSEGGVWTEVEDVIPAEFMNLPGGISLTMDNGTSYLAAQTFDCRELLVAARFRPEDPWRWTTYWDSPGRGETYNYPRLSLSNGLLHFGWITYERRELQPLCFRRNGSTDQHLERLGAFSTASKRHMSLDSDGDTVIACWSQMDVDHWEIFWQKSTDGGNSWQPQESILSSSMIGGWRPDIVLSGNEVCVVWEDYRDGNAEIYAKWSLDGGDTWSQDNRLTNQQDYSIRPQVAITSGEAYVVWQDLRDGNWEIYGTPVSLY